MANYLWLDDERNPPSKQEGISWLCAKDAPEAIEILRNENIEFASLDHDLCEDHYVAYMRFVNNGIYDLSKCKTPTGLEVLNWMKQNDVWPSKGVRVHTMNHLRKVEMLNIINTQYGQTFQLRFPGTHSV